MTEPGTLASVVARSVASPRSRNEPSEPAGLGLSASITDPGVTGAVAAAVVVASGCSALDTETDCIRDAASENPGSIMTARA